MRWIKFLLPFPFTQGSIFDETEKWKNETNQGCLVQIARYVKEQKK